ncbi:MAG: sensor histidine kinase [Solirubrobacterales bacterium]|nr:sensor histidine kinase [Solirubrobacterales bacterium]
MRRRLALTIAAVATVAIVLFALPLAAVLHRSYLDEELLRLQRDTVAATRQIDAAAPSGDPVELPSGGDVLTVYDAGGRRIAGPGPAQADGLVREALANGRPATRRSGGALLAAIPLLSNERVAGAVLATRSDDRVDRDTRRAWLLLAALAIVLIGLAAFAAVLFGRRLSAPLERLADAARRLGSGDFSVRAPRSGVGEIDAVGTALDSAAARLEDMVGRERSFSADASHQLRTPLAALRLELEAMALDDERNVGLQAAIAQVDRLQSTIHTLLAVAREPSEGDAVADLVALVDDALERWRGPLAGAGRALRSTPAEGPTEVRARPGVVSEILDVLLDNATRHGAGEVLVAVRSLDGLVAVDVGDQGPGFADPEAAFTRRSGESPGHGIGLALARALAHAEGGRLSITAPGPRPVLSLLLRAGARPPRRDAAGGPPA